MARSSSSQSSSESWQPSQEANFQTARRGLRLTSTLDLPEAEEAEDPVVGEDRPVPAHEHGAELAMAAEAHGALHVPLQGDHDALQGDAAALQAHGREA